MGKRLTHTWEISGWKKSGLPILQDGFRFLRWCWYLKQRGKKCVLILKELTKDNSRPQQKYYRGVVLAILARDTGYSDDEMHGLIQDKFFRYYNEQLDLYYIRSTAIGEWEAMEWEDKMVEVRMWASEFLGVYIPLPNEVEGWELGH